MSANYILNAFAILETGLNDLYSIRTFILHSFIKLKAMAKKKMQIPDGLAGLVRAAQEESSVNFDQTTEILTENKAPREPEQKENDKLVVETKRGN